MKIDLVPGCVSYSVLGLF